MEAVRKNEGAELKPEESWTEDDELQIIDTIERWAEKELKPIAMKYDQADEYPHEVVEQMKELGLFGATVSPQYGGLGLSATTYAKIVSAVCRVWMAPTGIFNSHLILSAPLTSTGACFLLLPLSLCPLVAFFNFLGCPQGR